MSWRNEFPKGLSEDDLWPEALRRTGLSVAELAVAACVVPKTVENWKAGHCTPQLLTARRIIMTCPWVLPVVFPAETLHAGAPEGAPDRGVPSVMFDRRRMR